MERKQYTGIPLKIMKLLGQGILPVEAARACGVDESYVSQLKAEPDFTTQVNEMVAETFKHQSEIDENYVEVERILSKRLREQANLMFSPDQVLRTLKFANEAKRKLAPAAVNPNGNGSGQMVLQPVILTLPFNVASEFILNPNNEVVGVNGKELTTLPSKNINDLVAKYKDNVKQSKLPFRILEEKKDGSRQSDPYSDL